MWLSGIRCVESRGVGFGGVVVLLGFLIHLRRGVWCCAVAGVDSFVIASLVRVGIGVVLHGV